MMLPVAPARPGPSLPRETLDYCRLEGVAPPRSAESRATLLARRLLAAARGRPARARSPDTFF